MKLNKIDLFKGKNRFLSNFYPAKVIFEDIEYESVENAYQAAKLDDIAQRLIIATLSPFEAKRYLSKESIIKNNLKVRDDWYDVSLDIMYRLVRQKFFKHEHLARRLLDTGDQELIEGNWWGDTFYGVCRGKGENHLGKIIMRVREELRTTIANKEISYVGS